MGINFKNSRILGSLIIVVAALIVLGGKLIHVQIIDHQLLLAQSKVTSSYKVKIPAARGEILDRNGQKLVTNRQGNSLIVTYGAFPSGKDNGARNQILHNTLRLLDRSGQSDKIVTHLPLTQDAAGNIIFTEDSQQEIKNMKSKDLFYLADYATALDCFQAMAEKYELQGYSTQDALRVGGLRYELSRSGFSYSTPVTIAEDVSSDVVLLIKENANQSYNGLDVQVSAYREYTDGSIAPHILGTTTKMTAELYAKLKAKGYGLNDIVGESGIEQAMESYLRGTDGEKIIKVDEDGNVTEEVTKEPVQGRAIVLTIDKDLQKVAQDQLAAVIPTIQSSSKNAALGFSNAGAVVVEDVRTGEILAAANYPTFDISRYREDYDALSKQSTLPLWNRFAMGTYAPGSTFKPGIALTALETGSITEDYTYKCTGVMEYRGQEFHCQGNKAHGTVNVYEAIEESCNLFFYSLAEKMGIQKMNEFSSDFGFGQRTGVEITESKGILSGKEYADSIGADWTAGQLLQSAVGQSYNQTTILQLASYTSTIANGGTRYQSHFVKQILSYDCSEVVSDTKPSALETLDLKTNALGVVQNSMYQAVHGKNGSAMSLKTANIPMAAKTGTAEVGAGDSMYTNGFLVSYAPYDKPEIAIAAVAEHARGGAYLGAVEREIANAYFSTTEYVVKPQGYIDLLP